ncbi:quercetin dioxygenase-like cupin family protein [Roseinatronobacter thiooxidans]|uniref:Quercetin dioxygenase-like cupin family protein n=1 Tax=Roseinatronobacter thiooxidans TaxID=121821 RepID=A0A2W7RFM6_9RHOB|nr:cupin domain-containing protein [Roseinatronobacter thiooxidans]PZX36752.1 quercetin dioxygenase-like cupin family protein [Roseinatronobacter thiooxidans]
MEIRPAGSTPSQPAPSEYFTGTVWQDPICDPSETRALISLMVTFTPGSRTHWHTHPLGQTLLVVSGCGLIQYRGGLAQTIRAGDRVWIPPGEEHWHGAGPDTLMRHIAMQEVEDGVGAHWLEPVSEADYGPRDF